MNHFFSSTELGYVQIVSISTFLCTQMSSKIENFRCGLLQKERNVHPLSLALLDNCSLRFVPLTSRCLRQLEMTVRGLAAVNGWRALYGNKSRCGYEFSLA
jgi:hypothetical protein